MSRFLASVRKALVKKYEDRCSFSEQDKKGSQSIEILRNKPTFKGINNLLRRVAKDCKIEVPDCWKMSCEFRVQEDTTIICVQMAQAGEITYLQIRLHEIRHILPILPRPVRAERPVA